MLKYTQDILDENKRRNDTIFAEYNPYRGIGSPIARFEFKFSNEGVYYLPNEMMKYDVISKSVKYGSLHQYLSRKGLKGQFLDYKDDIMKLRIKYDFEYWAATCIEIMSKPTPDSPDSIPMKFVLRLAQRIMLLELEKMRTGGLPIRLVLLKARQWGGSTLVQIYMMWIQQVHKENWNAAVIAQDDGAAMNIRQMYQHAAMVYPKEIATITLKPYQGSSKNLVHAERGGLLAVGSVENPKQFRSYKYEMCHLCLSPDTQIPTKDGFIKLASEISVGDSIITHTGKSALVSSITKSSPNEFNGNGSAVVIKTWLGHDTTLTPNHPVWTSCGWVDAGNLKKDDYVSIPIRAITDNIKYIQLGESKKRKQHGGTVCKANNAIIYLTKEIGYAFGYYLAEGCIKYNVNKRPASITFIRNDNEERFADKVINALRPYIASHSRIKRANTKTTLEHIYSAVLAEYICNNLGVKEYKVIPDWFFDCGIDFLTGLVSGYFSGDGSKTNMKQRNYELSGIAATTVSSSIAVQMRDIIASLGIGYGRIFNHWGGYHFGRNCKDAFILCYYGSAAKQIRSLIGLKNPDNGHKFSEKYILGNLAVWLRIKSVTKTKVDTVYDIEVDHKDHSFRTLHFPVKNSEVAFWGETAYKSASSLAQSIKGSIPRIPYTLIVEESTAKGVGTYFHEKWTSAKDGKSEYTPLFVPWWIIEMYQKPISDYKKWFSQFEKGFKKLDQVKEVKDYADFLWSIGASLESINWYFDYKQTENAGQQFMFEEYPSTADEAFVSSGRRCFDIAYVNNARRTVQDPLFVGDMEADSSSGKECLRNLDFKESVNGLMKVWALPDKSSIISNRYLVVCDIGGKWAGADWSVITVFDRYWLAHGGGEVIAAEWRGHLDQDLVAYKAAQIASFYNTALLVVERNSLKVKDIETEGDHSMTILDLIAIFYDNLYARATPDEIKDRLPPKYGFFTSAHAGGTKTMVVDALNAALRDGSYEEMNYMACNEMDTYEIKQDGTYGARAKCNDDLVMCRCIGLHISRSFMDIPRTLVKETSRRRVVSEASI